MRDARTQTNRGKQNDANGYPFLELHILYCRKQYPAVQQKNISALLN